MTDLQMPYLHWDTHKCFSKRATFLQGIFHGNDPPVPPGLEKQRKAIYEISKKYLNMGSSFHPRRSLDQFFYSHLSDTTQRDNDQVITKNTKWSKTGGPKMAMVDQLWLWVIDPNITEVEEDGENASGKTPEALEECGHQSLVTFFPRKECEDEEAVQDMHWDAEDLRVRILDYLKDHPSERASAWVVAAITIQQAVEAMFTARNQSLDFLEIFRAAIGKAVSDTIPFWCPP